MNNFGQLKMNFIHSLIWDVHTVVFHVFSYKNHTVINKLITVELKKSNNNLQYDKQYSIIFPHHKNMQKLNKYTTLWLIHSVVIDSQHCDSILTYVIDSISQHCNWFTVLCMYITVLKLSWKMSTNKNEALGRQTLCKANTVHVLWDKTLERNVREGTIKS